MRLLHPVLKFAQNDQRGVLQGRFEIAKRRPRSLRSAGSIPFRCAGERPPLSQDDWHAEFDKYRASPEFQRLNSRMTLEEFKFIFWMEYAHRMWGRALGLVFAVPGAYFVAKGCITRPLAARLAVLFAMGGAQVHFAARQTIERSPVSGATGLKRLECAGLCWLVDGSLGAAEAGQ